MSLLTERCQLLIRCPIWGITPAGMADFLQRMAEASRFMSVKPSTAGTRANKIAVIPVQGVLTKDAPWAGTTYGAIADAVDGAVADASVKRIVLSFDSPGGEVTGLPETAAVIAKAARAKPVSAHVDGMAASAAYWLASQSSDIAMSPSSEVGSVGVRMMHTDITKALDDAGLKVTELYSGDYETEWSPFQPLSDAAKENMQTRLDSMHADFIKAVGDGRGARTTSGIRKVRYGEGRMFTAKEAVGHGLADAVLSSREFYRAIQSAEQQPGGLPTVTRARLDITRARLEMEKARF